MADGDVLGCGEYEAFFAARGGRKLTGAIPWADLSWGRVLDDTSDATVNAVASDECCAAFAETDTWRNELLIYRDGVEVWAGPITDMAAIPERPTVAARDLSAWWDRRRIHSDHAYSTTDLATIFQALSDDAMAPDNSPQLFALTEACGILGDLNVLAAQHKKAGPLLRTLSSSGIDWTVVARRVLAGGLVVPTAAITRPFVVDHFVNPPTVRKQGTKKTNDWIVAGAGGGAQGDSVYGEAQDVDGRNVDGLLEDVATDSTIQDDDTATAAALGKLGISTNPIVVENAILAPTAPFTIDELIPGSICRLDLDTCIPVDDYFRLKGIKVTRNDQGEQVSVLFQPLGVSSTDG